MNKLQTITWLKNHKHLLWFLPGLLLIIVLSIESSEFFAGVLLFGSIICAIIGGIILIAKSADCCY